LGPHNPRLPTFYSCFKGRCQGFGPDLPVIVSRQMPPGDAPAPCLQEFVRWPSEVRTFTIMFSARDLLDRFASPVTADRQNKVPGTDH
jgi:hypothetical protein